MLLFFQDQPKITTFLNDTVERKKISKTDKCNKLCIVCKTTARVGSIYCSDECITKHAQDAFVSTKLENSSYRSEITTFPTKDSTATDVDFDKKYQTLKIVKIKEDPVVVFEKSTNRCLTGTNAPTAQYLNQWLKEHPTFQAVTPGTSQMHAIMSKKRQLQEVASKMQTESVSSKVISKPTKIQTKLKLSAAQNLTITSPKELSEIKDSALKSHTTKISDTSSSAHLRHVGKSSNEKIMVKKQPNDLQKKTPGIKDSRDHDIIRLKSKEGLQVRRRPLGPT